MRSSVLGLTTGLFGTATINMLITAGEKKGQAKIIATPRVTTLNNRKAKIESKTQIPISTIQAGEAGGDPIITTTYVDVPLKLEITPQITDVGTVVLDILAENASAAASQSGATPTINTQTMETQVTVPDGGTTVVGGVLFDDERESQDRTPGLSRIPLLGNLFKRKGVERNTNEILFFITPRISRPDFGNTSGSSGVRPSATIIQPVPLGNPSSNSDTVVPGVLQPPMVGKFLGDVGEFFGDEHVDGRKVLCRFLWTRAGDRAPRWEQAFSEDGGTTWETNWVMTFSRHG